MESSSIHIAAERPTGGGTVAGLAPLVSGWREGDALTAPARDPISYGERFDRLSES